MRRIVQASVRAVEAMAGSSPTDCGQAVALRPSARTVCVRVVGGSLGRAWTLGAVPATGLPELDGKVSEVAATELPCGKNAPPCGLLHRPGRWPRRLMQDRVNRG